MGSDPYHAKQLKTINIKIFLFSPIDHKRVTRVENLGCTKRQLCIVISGSFSNLFLFLHEQFNQNVMEHRTFDIVKVQLIRIQKWTRRKKTRLKGLLKKVQVKIHTIIFFLFIKFVLIFTKITISFLLLFLCFFLYLQTL